MQVFLRGNPIANALTASVAVMTVLALTLTLAEPVVSHGATDTSQFTVDQEITSEISFLSPATDVTMDTAIAAITGGSSLGTTTFNVSTNNAAGYNVTLVFADDPAMNSTSSTSTIPNYTPTAGVTNADYNMSVPTGGEFAYAVYNQTTPLDVDDTFESDGGGDCTGFGTSEVQQCWFMQDDSTVAETIINSSSPTAAGGATSTVTFQVQLAADSGIESGWYRATATLTATTN